MIRQAQQQDIPEMVLLRIQFLNEVNDRQPPVGFAGELSQYFQRALADGSFSAWLAVEEGRIVATSGMCIHTVAPNYYNPSGKSAYILNMFTVPEARGRGLASQLFARLLEEARERGCGKASLHATEAGRMVYKKFGFAFTDDEMSLSL